ncbi:MAG: histidine--tRNA ligase [Methylobacterium sp.]|nr:histidine--tRNA ligase [Methylobacterium sp.]MCA3658996.1 histidine--tRNA ligase [Methylobacterium sp.]MCA3663664.1 histidine--tRNA ligase [Methylobacterium sp.]MCA3665669.1 histidine--tRNA ligase [Methylobacterium sp.]MCA3670208.1 histidine--tRNA ligase [Methylobacterium sp.]
MSTEKTGTETPKPARTEARRPRGLPDRSPADIRATNEMMRVIQRVYELYGFEPVETPFLEYTDALGKFLPDQDRPNAGVFSLRDDDEQWMSLRYDLTAPLARYCAENWQNLPKPYRSYRAGWVFRNEKPGPGRFRQFMQFDADTVGSGSVAADAEICMMAADTLEALGIPRGQYVIKVNNRKILDGVMETLGIDDGQKLTVMRAIDKADKFDRVEISKLLGAGRWDGGDVGKGDFTKGAGLNDRQIIAIFGLMDLKASHQLFEDGTYAMKHAESLPFAVNETFLSGIAELRDMGNLFDKAGYHSDRILIDPSVVRGLEYYTGPVFEAELTFSIPGEDGKPIRFGSVGGGGRYDGLVSRFLDEPVPATGFSIGVSRLRAALDKLAEMRGEKTGEVEGPVIVLAMDKTPEAMASYQQIVASLRGAGIPSEIYLGSAGMKAQLKYADKRNARVALIQGSNEREKGEVQVKDLILGATLTDIKDRTEYLAKQAEAQFAVPVSEVVAKVREVLARHR